MRTAFTVIAKPPLSDTVLGPSSRLPPLLDIQTDNYSVNTANMPAHQAASSLLFRSFVDKKHISTFSSYCMELAPSAPAHLRAPRTHTAAKEMSRNVHVRVGGSRPSWENIYIRWGGPTPRCQTPLTSAPALTSITVYCDASSGLPAVSQHGRAPRLSVQRRGRPDKNKTK